MKRMVVEVTHGGLVRPLAQIEADVIRLVLEAVSGDVKLAAFNLSVSRGKLYAKIAAAGIDLDKIRRENQQ